MVLVLALLLVFFGWQSVVKGFNRMIYYSQALKGFYDKAIANDVPPDAVAVTPEDRRLLLEGESKGRIITCDKNGYPMLADAPTPTTEELAAIARGKRDTLIAETDYLVMPDYPQDVASLTAIKEYRQALRDVPVQPGFPEVIQWPNLTSEE